MKSRGVEWGALIALAVAIGTGLVWLGRLDGRVAALEKAQDRVSGAPVPSAPAPDSQSPRTRAGASDPVSDSLRLAAIRSPENGALVDQRVMVSGTSRPTTPPPSLWLFVYSHESSTYFPQAHAPDVAVTGDWSAAAAFGDRSSNGGNFDVLITTVDSAARKEAEAYVRANPGGGSGLASLPRGTEIQHRTTVKRW